METLYNLKKLIGRDWNNNSADLVDDIIIAFEEEGEVVVEDSQNSGYDKIAYINEDDTQYLFKLENNKIIDVWIA